MKSRKRNISIHSLKYYLREHLKGSLKAFAWVGGKRYHLNIIEFDFSVFSVDFRAISFLLPALAKLLKIKSPPSWKSKMTCLKGLIIFLLNQTIGFCAKFKWNCLKYLFWRAGNIKKGSLKFLPFCIPISLIFGYKLMVKFQKNVSSFKSRPPCWKSEILLRAINNLLSCISWGVTNSLQVLYLSVEIYFHSWTKLLHI